ncbi:protein-glutamine gamma-glutamyltransferase TgpA [Oceaniserpentilla sp. 4NH20-0058]
MWRALIFNGRLIKPNRFMKSGLVVIGFTGIYISYGSTITIESMVSLLIAGIMLKPLEVEKQSDAYLLIFLNYFLCGLLFLFGQSPLDFMLVILVMLFTLSAQVMIHLYGNANRKQASKTAVLLFVKSIPLALFLFFVVPRLGPLWTLNISTQSGVVGLSDSMSPGSMASLGRSNELAFRVELVDGDLPMSERYWRAFTLSSFNGNEWNRSNNLNLIDGDFTQNNDQLISYDVLLEPHEKKWLFSLGVPKISDRYIKLKYDASLQSTFKIYNQIQYRVTSRLGSWIDQKTLTKRELQQYLQFPKNVNEQSVQFSKALSKHADGDALKLVGLIETYISGNEFEYTLQPGVYDGSNQIDHFLFQSKSGFCSYYAGSLAFLLRAAGVPSRVVAGYMGGEENPVSNTLSIYQYDAHAWVEVWIEGKGWYRVDPTAWVSPERVQNGLQQAVPSGFTGFTSQSKWLVELRRQFQAVDYFWNDWMIRYKGEKQQAILTNIIGDRTSTELSLILMLSFLLLLACLFLFVWFDQVKIHVRYEERLLDQLQKWLIKHNVKVTSSHTIGQVIEILIDIYPEQTEQLVELKSQVNESLYASSNGVLSKHTFKAVISKLKKIQKQANK